MAGPNFLLNLFSSYVCVFFWQGEQGEMGETGYPGDPGLPGPQVAHVFLVYRIFSSRH